MRKALLFLVAVATATVAQAGFVDFEGFPWGGTINGVPNPASVITGQYAGQGVVFGRAGVSAGVAAEGCCGLLAISGVNAAIGLDAAGVVPPVASGDIYFSFLSPASGVSFWIGDIGGDLDPFQIRAYDSGDLLIETQNVANNAMFLVTLASSGIKRVEVDFLGGPGYGMDDLTFSVAIVPEPATWSLCLAAGAALLWLRRRNA